MDLAQFERLIHTVFIGNHFKLSTPIDKSGTHGPSFDVTLTCSGNDYRLSLARPIHKNWLVLVFAMGDSDLAHKDVGIASPRNALEQARQAVELYNTASYISSPAPTPSRSETPALPLITRDELHTLVGLVWNNDEYTVDPHPKLEHVFVVVVDMMGPVTFNFTRQHVTSGPWTARLMDKHLVNIGDSLKTTPRKVLEDFRQALLKH